MYLSNDIAKVNISRITEVSSCDVDMIYDCENYSQEEMNEILLIEIESDLGFKKIVLYCDLVGNYEYCTVLQDRYLVIVKFNTAYRIDILTLKIEHKVFSDMAGAMRLYLLEDGYLILGECEIVKLDFEFNKQWDFSGSDIFSFTECQKCVTVSNGNIELLDFSGNRYTIPLTTDFIKQVEEKEELYKSYKEITENPIVLDFTACGGWRGIHPMLKKKFGFPDYYGENWDALWDCLSMLFDAEITVEIHNFYSLEPEIQEYCKPMFKIFEDVHKETPNVVFKIIS